MDWTFFGAMLLFIYSFAAVFSVFAILMEVMTYNQYKKRSEIVSLILTALLEPLIFHPFTIWAAVKGNIDLLQKKKSWGEMSRQGFATKKAA
jgi:heme O synthase-like polyprenyltransferase